MNGCRSDLLIGSVAVEIIEEAGDGASFRDAFDLVAVVAVRRGSMGKNPGSRITATRNDFRGAVVVFIVSVGGCDSWASGFYYGFRS